jgi:GTP cyclohydrolase II
VVQLTSSSSDLAAALQLSMRAVQHENVDVRIHALTSLRDMMHSKQVPPRGPIHRAALRLNKEKQQYNTVCTVKLFIETSA